MTALFLPGVSALVACVPSQQKQSAFAQAVFCRIRSCRLLSDCQGGARGRNAPNARQPGNPRWGRLAGWGVERFWPGLSPAIGQTPARADPAEIGQGECRLLLLTRRAGNNGSSAMQERQAWHAVQQ